MKKWYLFGSLSAMDLLYLTNLRARNVVVNILIIVALAGFTAAMLMSEKERSE